MSTKVGSDTAGTEEPEALSSVIHYDKLAGFAQYYLRTYYSGDVTEDERAVFRFLAKHFPRVENTQKLLEVGCGPTVHHLLPVIRYCSEVTLADFLEENLSFVRDWLEQRESAHNWTTFTKLALQLEGYAATEAEIREREALVQKRVKELVLCDLRSDKPLQTDEQFPVVGCFYTTETVTVGREEWGNVMRRLTSLVAPGGHLFMSALRQSTFYRLSPSVTLPTTYLREADFAETLLSSGFDEKSLVIEVETRTGLEEEGLNGILLVTARKRLDAP